MLRVLRFPGLLLLGVIFLACRSLSYAQNSPGLDPSDACLAFKKGLSLGVPLVNVKAKLRTGQRLTIVALGSSSTTGFGTFRSDAAFPSVMREELLRLRPSARIELINNGHVMETIAGNIARIDYDVLRNKPDLVVWQFGTNEAVWRGIPNNTKRLVIDAVRQLKAVHSDVIFVDLQYAPLVLATTRHIEMEKIITDIAREQNVGIFPRFLLMKRAIDADVKGLVWWDGLHNSTEGHRCIGIALAQMIDAAAR